MRSRVAHTTHRASRWLKRFFLPGDPVRFQNRWYDIESVTDSGYLLISDCGNDSAFVFSEDKHLLESEGDIMIKFEQMIPVLPDVCRPEIFEDSIQKTPVKLTSIVLSYF